MNIARKIILLIILLPAFMPLAHASYIPFNTNAAGNIGIGSTAPGQRLDVQGTVRATGFVGNGSGLTGLSSGLWATQNTTDQSLVGGNVGIGTTITNAGAALSVMNGNVGIGTWVPAAALDIAGNLQFSKAARTITTGNDGTNGYALTIQPSNGIGSSTGNGGAITIQAGQAATNGGSSGAGGNITITAGGMNGGGGGGTSGTVSITSGAAAGGQTSGALNISTGTGGIGDGAITISTPNTSTFGGNINITAGSGAASSGSIILTTTNSGSIPGTTQITGGNVGISTTNPLGKLIVWGGNVGIGSNVPGQALDVQGTVRASYFVGNGSLLSGLSSSQWVTQNSTDVSLAGGNVGIGTTITNAGAALTVMNGNVGIGTWVPKGALEIEGGNVGIGTYSFYSTTSGPFALSIANNDGILLNGQIQWTDTNVIDFSDNELFARLYAGGEDTRFQSWNGSDVLTNMDINGSSGNIGIGTTTPMGGLVVMNGNVGIGTWVPSKSLVLNQKSTTDGFQFTGTSISNVNGGTGFLMALGYNNPGNKQLWLGDVDYAGSSSGYFNRYGIVNGYPFFDVIRGDDSAYGTINLGSSGGSNVAIDGSYGVALTPASNLWVNGNTSIGSGYQSNAAPANGLLVQGNVGIGSTAPGQTLDVQGTVRTTNFTMSGQTPASGYVLTASDSSGDVTWSSAGGVSGWTTTNTNDVYETGNGNVGIGTTITSAGAALSVMNGNVGIGTWVPSSTLAVEGQISAIASGATANLTALTNGTNYPRGAFQIGNSTSDVNVGVYVSPSYSSNGLQIPALISVATDKTPSDSNEKEALLYQTTTYALIGALQEGGGAGTNGTPLEFSTQNDVITGSTPALYISNASTQNVGISTISPVYKLDVNGDIGNSTGGNLYLQDKGGSVYTKNNTLDDGSGDVSIPGTISAMGGDVLINSQFGNTVFSFTPQSADQAAEVMLNSDSTSWSLSSNGTSNTSGSGVFTLNDTNDSYYTPLEIINSQYYSLSTNGGDGDIVILGGYNDGNSDAIDQTSTLQVLGDANISGGLTVGGKLNENGGVDPPFVLLDVQTQAQIIDRMDYEVPVEKRSGLTLYWDGKNLNGLTVDADGNGTVYQIQMTRTGTFKMPNNYNTRSKNIYYWDAQTQSIKSMIIGVHDHSRDLPKGERVDHATGKIISMPKNQPKQLPQHASINQPTK